jgi:tRNA-(ms[2]io[6]A)-hydroxylase
MNSYQDFLVEATPDIWVKAAPKHIAVLLSDHANCEYKAAHAALGFLKRFGHYPKTQPESFSRIAREELLHYELVRKHMRKLEVPYLPISASRYAKELLKLIKKNHPDELLGRLIVCAFIEARSCERFNAVVPVLNQYPSIQKFYQRLVSSENRHFKFYLDIASALYPKEKITEYVDKIRLLENALITGFDEVFRFHSGVPRTTQCHYALSN